MEENKRKPGRPKADYKLPESWKQIIIDSGKEGKHITDFLIILGITFDQHYTMMERNKEYSSAVQDYQKYCEQYWYNMAHNSMSSNGGAQFNSKLWSLIVRNKFPKHWSESTRVDVTTQGDKITDDKNITIEIIKPKDN
jgi:hypothetical protein